MTKMDSKINGTQPSSLQNNPVNEDIENSPVAATKAHAFHAALNSSAAVRKDSQESSPIGMKDYKEKLSALMDEITSISDRYKSHPNPVDSAALDNKTEAMLRLIAEKNGISDDEMKSIKELIDKNFPFDGKDTSKKIASFLETIKEAPKDKLVASHSLAMLENTTTTSSGNQLSRASLLSETGGASESDNLFEGSGALSQIKSMIKNKVDPFTLLMLITLILGDVSKNIATYYASQIEDSSAGIEPAQKSQTVWTNYGRLVDQWRKENPPSDPPSNTDKKLPGKVSELVDYFRQKTDIDADSKRDLDNLITNLGAFGPTDTPSIDTTFQKMMDTIKSLSSGTVDIDFSPTNVDKDFTSAKVKVNTDSIAQYLGNVSTLNNSLQVKMNAATTNMSGMYQIANHSVDSYGTLVQSLAR